MATQGAAADAGVPRQSSIQTRKLQVGDKYRSRQELTTVVKLNLHASGRDCICDGGGGRQASWRCAGRVVIKKKDVGCRFRVKATKQTRGEVHEWKLTGVHDEHVNCSRARAARGLGVAELQTIRAAIVSANPGISAPSLTLLIKEHVGGNVHERTLSRLKRRAREDSALPGAEDFQLLDSYAKHVATDCRGSVTDVRVRCMHASESDCVPVPSRSFAVVAQTLV